MLSNKLPWKPPRTHIENEQTLDEKGETKSKTSRRHLGAVVQEGGERVPSPQAARHQHGGVSVATLVVHGAPAHGQGVDAVHHSLLRSHGQRRLASVVFVVHERAALNQSRHRLGEETRVERRQLLGFESKIERMVGPAGGLAWSIFVPGKQAVTSKAWVAPILADGDLV